MTILGHGATRSFCTVVFPRSYPPTLMRLRPLHGARCNSLMRCRRLCMGVPRLNYCCSFLSKSFSRRFSAGRARMETPGATQRQIWHVSRGIVFARDTKVVYPRLPAARYHSAPTLSTYDRDVSELLPGQGLKESCSVGSLANGDASNDNGPVPVVNDDTLGAEAPTVDEATYGAGVVAEEPAHADKELLPCKPPVTDLEYQIPDEAFQAAKNAPQGNPESFWSYSLYRGPSEDGSLERKVKVHYCTSSHTTQRVLKQYFLGEKIIGFDLEWAPNAVKSQGPRRNVSLVQIASPSRIALFHLALYPKGDDLVAPLLRQIMEDPSITKVGVWIKGDCTRLRTFLDINARGTFELSHLYKLVKYSATGQHSLVNKKLVSLAKQVEGCLGLPLFKGEVRVSDWCQSLRMDQLVYSASDAYAALQVYAALDYQRKQLDPTPPLPHHAELNLPIEYLAPPTPDEESEEPIEVDANVTEGESNAFTQYLESIDGINVEAEDSAGQAVGAVVSETLSMTVTTTVTTTAITPVSKSKPTPQRPAEPQDPRVAEASLWARQHHVGRNRGRAPIPALRAYYLWHRNEELGVKEVAALLRDPPLALSTVNNYIAEAIRADSLPFNKRRLWKDVLAEMPDATRELWRYKPLVKACSEEDPEE